MILDEVLDADTSDQAPINKVKGKMKDGGGESDHQEVPYEYEKFKVVGRVMGVWEIMEEPTNQYTFI